MMMKEILKQNKKFVGEKAYEKYQVDKCPAKQLAILTCMDTRLTELLPAALGLKNGDAKMIRNAGGCICDPFGSEVRSILIAIAKLKITKVMVIGHTDCGTEHLSGGNMLDILMEKGIGEKDIEELEKTGLDVKEWLEGFEDKKESVRKTVELLRNHPLIPETIMIEGAVIDTETGSLESAE